MFRACVTVALAASVAHADEPPKPVGALRGWLVDLTGYVQVDAAMYASQSQDELDIDGNALNQQHFSIPRASLRVDAHKGPFTGELELEAFTSRATLPRPTQTSGVRLETAMLGWHREQVVEVIAGLFRLPWGAQTPTSPRDRPFLELPTMNRALFPGDIDAGVMVRGQYGYARYAIAATNGSPAGDAQWKGVDPSASYDVMARVGADVPLPNKVRVVGGVSAITGSTISPGTPGTKDQLVWVDENGDGLVSPSELQVLPGAPPTASEPFDHKALGVDLAVHWCICVLGTGYAFFEGAIATNLDRGLVYADPILRGRDLRELGFSVGVVQHVGDYAMVGVRFDRYDADRDYHEVEGLTNVSGNQRFQTWSFMASTLWGNARLLAQFDHARDPFGRDDSGGLVSLQDERLTLRAQVAW